MPSEEADARPSRSAGTEVRARSRAGQRGVDPLAASLAAERCSEADLAAIENALDGLEALPDDPSPQQLESHHRFHGAIHRASHNDLLVGMLDGLWVKTDRYRRDALRQGRTEDEHDSKTREHRLQLEAVRSGDGERAAELMRRHAENRLGARSAVRLTGQQETGGAGPCPLPLRLSSPSRG
jgi:DNA-binding GntR family transcriptional regulator